MSTIFLKILNRLLDRGSVLVLDRGSVLAMDRGSVLAMDRGSVLAFKQDPNYRLNPLPFLSLTAIMQRAYCQNYHRM